jgi:hypothetical protein
MLPNFLFLGPDKSGSSWLFEILLKHPQCFVPKCKDIYYFDKHYHRGQHWYESFFDNVPAGKRAIGELSHDYIFSDEAAARIARDLPNAKLLTILRNPVERTWSQYLYMMRNGYPAADFADAIERYPFLLSNSLYNEQIIRFQEPLAAGRLGVFWFDELVDNPTGFAERIFEYLGIDKEFTASANKKERSAAKPRSVLLASLTKKSATAVRKFGGARVVGRVKHSRITDILYRSYEKGEKPSMPDRERRSLIDAFGPAIEDLEQLLDVSLPHWKA